MLLPAAAAAEPLRLEAVLDSARQHTPQVLEALMRVRAAQGRRLEALGAFDTVFSASGDVRPTGFYDGGFLETRVEQPFADRGGFLYGGYRISGGSFPAYEGDRLTSQAGELKVGAVFALMRDRYIDDRRFAVIQADAEIALAETEALLVAIGIQRRALDAYLAWVAAGLRRQLFADLLALARNQQSAFERQVARGLRPEILLAENEQAIFRRETLLVQAEQQLQVAAQRLSLFWRDQAGEPLVPGPEQLPDALPALRAVEANLEAALARRPDLKDIDIRIAQAREQIALDRNLRRPRLDLRIEGSRDFGPLGQGGPALEGTETRVGLTFSLPLQQRTADGRIARTQAEILAFELRRRQIEEQIQVELGNLSTDLRAARQVVELARLESDRADRLAAGERRRFQLGASDLFLVTVREEQAADARVREIDAAVREVTARADIAAATVDLETLGL
ncbi:MAG: TolC family protein [Sphingomonadaceae bacterium]